MDPLDIRIVDVLQQHGDITHAELAAHVDSTASTCLRRVRALRQAGVLKQVVYLADPAKLGRPLQAIITVTTQHLSRAGREKMAKRIRREAAISSAFGVSGEVDAVLIGNFKNMAEYQGICDRLFDADKNTVRYTTHFVSETYFENLPISCDAAAGSASLV